MSYRAWPAALLAGVSLATACLVVGDHVVAASDGCLDAAGSFTAIPVVRTQIPDLGSGQKPAAGSAKLDIAALGGVDEGSGQSAGAPQTGGEQITGCLDLDRIEVPPPSPGPDGRA